MTRKLCLAMVSAMIGLVVAAPAFGSPKPKPGHPRPAAAKQNQAGPAAPATTAGGPVAYVYVSSTPPNSSADEVRGFAASATGQLSPLPGSPFQENVRSMAVNGKYLFGADLNPIYIDTYRIQPNGSLQYAAQTNIEHGQDCDNAGEVFLDHTGQSLYNLDFDGSQCANTTYENFAVNNNTGGLGYLNKAGASPELEGPLRFIGNNLYGYSASCYHFNPLIFGFRRESNGALTQLSLNAPMPVAWQGQNFCPFLAAADPTNHLAIAVQPMQGYGTTAGPYQLATYTVDSAGNLSTGSTYANMPSVQVGTVMDLNMAPSGQLLAVAGTSGLQIFHFNGAGPITAYTPLLKIGEVDQIFWDNNNHLFAISRTTGELYVYTVTPTGYSQAPGSPYAVSNPQALIVQPLPLP